jgi:hypothetical protein
MTMKIQSDTLKDEIDQIINILKKWQDIMTRGIPGDEIPANDLDSEIFQLHLRGEIQLAAERLMALVEVLES